MTKGMTGDGHLLVLKNASTKGEVCRHSGPNIDPTDVFISVIKRDCESQIITRHLEYSSRCSE